MLGRAETEPPVVIRVFVDSLDDRPREARLLLDVRQRVHGSHRLAVDHRHPLGHEVVG